MHIRWSRLVRPIAASATAVGGFRASCSYSTDDAVTATVGAMESLAPHRLAEGWDNVGMLVERSQVFSSQTDAITVFITNDLTKDTLEEAIAEGASLIITYHPRPFMKFKKLSNADPTTNIVLQCAAQGIAVYSPHTALDKAAGGINDWLAEGLGEGTVRPVHPEKGEAAGVGQGRILELKEPVPLATMLMRIKHHLGLEHLQLALSETDGGHGSGAPPSIAARARQAQVASVAVQAGAGSSVLGGCGADLFLTGEMSHHEVLAANAAGSHVVLTFHTNTERGYLPILAKRLEEATRQDSSIPQDKKPSFVVSKTDADPLNVV